MLGALVPTAFADHWHSYNNRTHGLEHGSSTTDGAYFGRTYGYYLGDTNSCSVGDTVNGVNYGTTSINADLCSVFTGNYYRAINECRGASYNAAGPANPLSGHYHYAHNYGGNCPVRID